jgi:hypothetical protein
MGVSNKKRARSSAGDLMAHSSKTLQSPKRLINVTSQRLHGAKHFKVEQFARNQWAFKACDVTAKDIRFHLARLVKMSRAFLKHERKDPAQFQKLIVQSSLADRTYFAARMLKELEWLERELGNVERCWDLESVRQSALNAISDALILASIFHLLTIADNEPAIVHGTAAAIGLARKRQQANAKRHAERSREWRRWNDEAQKIWARKPQLSRQAVATRVRASLHLADEVRTIAKRLKKSGTAC